MQRANLIEAVVRPERSMSESATGVTVFLLDYLFVKAFFSLEKMILFINFKKEAAEDSPERTPQSLKYKLNRFYITNQAI